MNARDYGNQPAYPFSPTKEAFAQSSGQAGEAVIQATEQHAGLTIRDAYILAALQSPVLLNVQRMETQPIAAAAVRLADATLAEAVRDGAK